MNRMKNTLIATLALFAGFNAVNAQKFAYIDTDYVLLHIQEYADAQAELNQMAIDWQVEIETKIQSIERLELAYRAERVLLTAEMRAKREEEISAKRLEARELQKSKFGVDGELFQKRQELIQPVQDMVFEELKDIASGSGYMVVFDKSNQSNMLYTNPKYDISDRLIKKLGYVPGETLESDTKEGDEGKSIQDRAKDAMDKGKSSATDRMRGAASGMRGGNTINSKNKN
ncbi:MAG: hypothetical protein CL834_01345 [Crocinitomicaceae bacterium]|nr:hypothetical protein [Crocinitomicaceae bacterium]|tara:strand:+ start:1048 stop:1737 length:690 start_codon:yes stop_codon:yes gene_type:complete